MSPSPSDLSRRVPSLTSSPLPSQDQPYLDRCDGRLWVHFRYRIQPSPHLRLEHLRRNECHDLPCFYHHQRLFWNPGQSRRRFSPALRKDPDHQSFLLCYRSLDLSSWRSTSPTRMTLLVSPRKKEKKNTPDPSDTLLPRFPYDEQQDLRQHRKKIRCRQHSGRREEARSREVRGLLQALHGCFKLGYIRKENVEEENAR